MRPFSTNTICRDRLNHTYPARKQRTTPSALRVARDIRIQDIYGLSSYDAISFSLRRALTSAWKEQKGALPELSPTQITKLKHLSLLSYAMQQRVSLSLPYPSLRISPGTQVIPYSFLQTHLDIPTIRLLEDLIIDAIYLDIIRGKLDQNEQQFEVEYTIGRDVPPESVTEILSSLENWYAILSP